MGRRGPPPTPTGLRIVKGNPGKRPLNTQEPKPRGGPPRCPSWLDDEAKRVWRRTVRELAGLNVLTHADRDALAAYCQTFSRWKRAELFLQERGDVYSLKDDKGGVKCLQQFPQVAIARNLAQLVRSYQQEFGLTPSARSRIRADGGGPGDELDAFVQAHGDQSGAG